MPHTPVLIGAAQISEAPDRPGYRARSPLALAIDAVRAAIADCGATGDVAAAADTIAAIRQFEISTPWATAPFGHADNLPRAVAARIGADPARAILGPTGGQVNQALVGELAHAIAEGRSELAILFGAEAISTVLHLQAQGETRDWSDHTPGSLEDRGYGLEDLFDEAMVRHGVAAPIPCYALLENARRARLGLSAAGYRERIATLFAPFTAVAAGNPHAAAPIRRSAAELATVTAQNRIVAEPYARLTVARDQVNQAACLILCSAARADALGVPTARRVHIHASATAGEPSPLQRPDLSRSPAAIAAITQALAMAGQAMPAMDAFDLYSCFALPVFNITDAFGLPADGARALTLTGGLPFFGGAGNNYSMHAIAEAVVRLRRGQARWALVGANGGFMSKYAAGIYALHPADWSDPAARHATLPAAGPRLRVTDATAGEAVIDTCTVVPGKHGDAGTVIATQAGARLVASAHPEDAEALAMLRDGTPFGRPITLSPANDGRALFSLGA